MSRRSRGEDPYAVGNKRPPKHSRFKPGQSGNPAGRPKGSTNLNTKFDKELRKTVLVTKNGKPTKMTKGDVIVAQLVDSSMKGDVRTAAIVLRFAEEVSVPIMAQGDPAEIPMPNKEALKRIKARLFRLVEED